MAVDQMLGTGHTLCLGVLAMGFANSFHFGDVVSGCLSTKRNTSIMFCLSTHFPRVSHVLVLHVDHIDVAMTFCLLYACTVGTHSHSKLSVSF